MSQENNLIKLIKNMNPVIDKEEYVFITTENMKSINRKDTLCEFKEKEGTTVILKRIKAEQYKLKYECIWSWITLNIISSLNAVGFTALISQELAKYGISCNMIAGYFHDHIFVAKKDKESAIQVLKDLSDKY